MGNAISGTIDTDEVTSELKLPGTSSQNNSPKSNSVLAISPAISENVSVDLEDDHGKTTMEKGFSSSNVAEHTYEVSDRARIIMATILFLLIGSVLGIHFATQEGVYSLKYSCVGCEILGRQSNVIFIFAVSIVGLAILGVFRLRNYNDPLKFRREAILCFAIGGIPAICGIIAHRAIFWQELWW